MTKHEIIEVLKDITSSRGSGDIPLSYVEKYLNMLDEDRVVSADSSPGMSSQKSLTDTTLSSSSILRYFST